jgi:acyl-CoA reductase-like NAD-dependent aldehyde dehydrogenase
MSLTSDVVVPLRHPDQFFIDGRWVAPSSDSTFDVVDSATEQPYFRVAEAQAPDMDRAVSAARTAFDEGPWPRLSHAERAEYLRRLAAGLKERGGDVGQIWPRESGVLHSVAQPFTAGAIGRIEYYAGLADTFPFEERAQPTGGGEFGLLVRDPRVDKISFTGSTVAGRRIAALCGERIARAAPWSWEASPPR